MPSVATIYIVATTAIFLYVVYDHLLHSDTYFKAMMTFLADQSCVFVLYNMILSLAILLYRIFTFIFFSHTMEGQVIKITDKLKNKIVDLIILAYIIDLKFDFQMYILVVFVTFSFILHNHLIFRSQYLVHVYSTSTSLNLHYRAIALYLTLFFFDFQIMKYVVKNMLSVSEPTQGIFVYYMASNAFSLLQPFMQFAMDFYEKFTFFHIKNSDEIIAKASIFITIPKLVVQLIICTWLSLQFKLIVFAIIRGLEIVANIKKTYDSYIRIKKLSQTMTFLKKLKGDQLEEFHDLTCTVCYQDMKQCVLLPCKHIFHEECIRQWIIKNLNHFCPKCKHQLNFDNAETLYEKKKEETPLDRMRNIIKEENNRNEEGYRRERSFEDLLPRDQNRYDQPSPRRREFDRDREEQEGEKRQFDRQRQDYNDRQKFYSRGTQYERQQQESPRRRQEKPERYNNYIQDALEHNRNTRQRVQIVNRQGRQIPIKQYIIDRPDLSDYPLEVYDSLRKKIVPVGSLPYGMPTVAVSNRTTNHMVKRQEYMREMEIITRLMEMDRNVQMMLL